MNMNWMNLLIWFSAVCRKIKRMCIKIAKKKISKKTTQIFKTCSFIFQVFSMFSVIFSLNILRSSRFKFQFVHRIFRSLHLLIIKDLLCLNNLSLHFHSHSFSLKFSFSRGFSNLKHLKSWMRNLNSMITNEILSFLMNWSILTKLFIFRALYWSRLNILWNR